MSKKTNSKSKSSSKSKPKASAKKPAKKTVKPAKKKSVLKPSGKAKPKPAAKVISKKKPVVKSKPAAKAKTTVKESAKTKAPLNIKSKTPVINKSKQNIKSEDPAKGNDKNTVDSSKNNTPQNRPSVGRPLPVNRRPEPARAIISNSKPEKETGKNRYADNELEEFRKIINKKLEEARKELATLQAQMTAANEHGTDDTASTFKILEDGSDSLAKEEAGQLASRQKKFIEQLENALVRIENKTYGICRVTGKLIPKERLRAVPHTTQSIEAKLNQYRD
jgi:RNA polymerase-binding transcription factor DksA